MRFKKRVYALERRCHAFEKGVHIFQNNIIFILLGCSRF